MSLNEKMEKMCRACLNTNDKYSELISLFSGGCASAGVPTKMMNVSNVMVHEKDGLPNMICQKCVFLVKVTDCFKKQLQLADMELRKIWDQAEGMDSNNMDINTAADGISDSEIEDLAFNPLYISDNVKEQVERAFTRKHQMFDNREFEEMSQFLTNLEKKRNVIVQTESEKSDKSIAKNMSDFEDLDRIKTDPNDVKSDEFLNIEEFEPEEIVKMEINDFSENSSEDNLKIELSGAAENSETLEVEKPSYTQENEVKKVDQCKTMENIKKVDNIIVISDSSDTESRFAEKAKRKMLPNVGALSLLGQKRKTVEKKDIGEASLKKTSVTGMPKIQVKKIFHSVQVGKNHRVESKTVPRTYFLCTTCNIRLKTVAAVLLHHNEIHSPNEKSLHCRMCNKSFPTKSHLLNHFDQHIETHLFRCSYCPNEFVLKANLTKHMLNHTKETSLEPANKRLKTSDVTTIEEKRMKTSEVNSTEENQLRTRDINSIQENKPEKHENEITKRDDDSAKENTIIS